MSITEHFLNLTKETEVWYDAQKTEEIRNKIKITVLIIGYIVALSLLGFGVFLLTLHFIILPVVLMVLGSGFASCCIKICESF